MTPPSHLTPIEKAKLKNQYLTLLKNWQSGKVDFDMDSFAAATELLKANLLPEQVIPVYARQVQLALQEALVNQTPLASFYQKPNTLNNTQMNTEGLGHAVQQLLDEGFSKQEAIQKVSVRYKTSAFKVNQQFRKLFDLHPLA